MLVLEIDFEREIDKPLWKHVTMQTTQEVLYIMYSLSKML